MNVIYIHLPVGSLPPRLRYSWPFRAVVVIEDDPPHDWQMAVSHWLVESGCLYMMAWGRGASTWDDSVDMANLKAFNYGEIPDDRFVMTTWHDDEALEDVFWFCGSSAFHSAVDLDSIVIVHIKQFPEQELILNLYASAQQGDAPNVLLGTGDP